MLTQTSSAPLDPRSQTQPVTVRRHYPDAPLVGVAAAVFNDAGHVLLVKRGRPPRVGQWGLPGGLLDLGEQLADGARREIREECQIEVEIQDVVATFEPIQRDEHGRVEYHYVVVDFWARLISGDAVAKDDADDLVWTQVAELARYQITPDTRQVIYQAYAAWQAANSAK